MIHNSKFFDNIGQVLRKYPDIDLRDMFAKGQMDSKRWLVDELVKLNIPLGIIFICAGWYGSLATFLFETDLYIKKIRSFDIDPSCADIADTYNRSWVMDEWKFKASTLDIMTMNYPLTHTTQRANGTTLELTEMPDTIINTSCEHIDNFKSWYDNIPSGTFLILQCNDYKEISDHVNCANDAEHFSSMAPMKQCVYLGELPLEKYTRFMKIGWK